MKSRLLTRLESDIRGASSHSAADCLRCERAAYLARHGDHDAATRELLALRERHDARQPHPSIYAWLNLAEGLIGHHRQPGPRVRDKLARAHALSRAAELRPLRALSAAWLAQLDCLRKDAAGAASHAAEALALAPCEHHAARARATLVIAQCFDEGGRYDLARPWYAQAHWHATAEGDDATLSATLWNMAALRVAAWRQAQACESPEAAALAHAEPGRHALASAESAALFDRLSGVATRAALQPVLRAQVCTLMGQTGEALALYEEYLVPALAQGMEVISGVLLADRAWCRLQAGLVDAARSDAANAAKALEAPGAHGDRAPGHSRLSQVYAALGDTAAARSHRESATERWAGHRADQCRLVGTLEKTLARLAP